MAVDPALSSRLALDAGALENLKTQARQSPDRALQAAAREFESVFMHMLLKSMRETLAQDGPFDSDATRMYTGMLDQQLAQTLAARGSLGLADMMVKQLSATYGAQGNAAPAANAPAAQRAPELRRMGAMERDAQQAFVERMLPHAHEAARRTGVPAQFILGQAALESGWGRREIKGSGGTPSYNLFGIKADPGWTGRTVDVLTTEYVDGRAQKVVQKFRAYASYAEAFADWAQLIANNPRYAKARNATGAAEFAQGLQQAGYATDPLYAEKLTRIINRQLAQRETDGQG